MAEILRTPRGTKDILPEEQKLWRFLSNIFSDKCESFGCGKIETPLFEYAEVFTKSLGVSSDVVSKEMYEVRRAQSISEMLDKEDETKTLVLRPEITAAVVRSYIEHGMKTWTQPVKLYYVGEPCFRYERPQSGRFREHRQLGVEIIGDADPLTDASTIFLAYQFLRKLGLAGNVVVDINSIGDNTCRPKIKKKLIDYFEKFLPSMCPDCNRRFVENPLRILDCKISKCQKIIENAPQVVDMLCNACKVHFKEVLENLDALGIPYNLNPRLVRGLDYYTRTVFELYEESDTTRQSTLIGGGRYDNLIKMFGGEDTPAVGFAAGMERIIDKLKDMGITVPSNISTEVSIIQIGEKARKISLPLLSELESVGISANCILGKESLKGQLRMASRMKAKLSVIIGQREVLDKSVILRNMDDGSQETIKKDKLIDVLKVKLGK